MRVLVVEDSRAMRMIVALEARRSPSVSEVLEAECAEAAIGLLEAQRVDLILCDWNLGGMSGIELLEALRAARWAVPFGFVTSEWSAEARERARAAGATFLLSKPFGPEELAAEIEAVARGGTSADPPGGERRAGGAATLDSSVPEVPRVETVRDRLGRLLRRTVVVVPALSGPARQVARWIADYADPGGEQVARWVVETELASAMAATLGLMPLQTAQEWASSGTLPGMLSDGFREVAGVLARVARPDGARCAVAEVAGLAPGEQLPGIERWREASSEEHFVVSVAGCGFGLCSFLSR